MRISSGHIHSDNTLTRTETPLPQNRGMSAIAQAAIDTLSTVAARRNIEAIRTDGYPVYVLRSRRGTTRCTCKGPLSLKKPEQISSVDFSMEDGYNPESNRPTTKSTIKVRGFGPEDSFLDRSDMFGMEVDPSGDYNTDLYAGEVGNYDAYTDADLANILFPSIDDKKCGICGGTGFTDSFTWVSGTRMLLLPSSAIFNDGFLNDATQPASMEITSGGYAEWTIQIPTYFQSVDVIKARDNVEPEYEVSLSIDKGAGFLPLSASSFDSLNGVGGQVKIRATAAGAALSVQMFTHIELWFRTVELPYCQFPQLERDTNPGAAESNLSPDYEIEQSVGELPRGSLIESPQHGRMFVVMTDRTKRTSKNIVFNVGGSSLVLQPNAPLAALAAVPRWTAKNARNWRGVEPGPERTGLTNTADTNTYDTGNFLGATGNSAMDLVPPVANNGLANDGNSRRLNISLTGLNEVDK